MWHQPHLFSMRRLARLWHCLAIIAQAILEVLALMEEAMLHQGVLRRALDHEREHPGHVPANQGETHQKRGESLNLSPAMETHQSLEPVCSNLWLQWGYHTQIARILR